MKAFVRNGLRFFPDGTKAAHIVPAGDYLMPVNSTRLLRVSMVQAKDGQVLGTNIETGEMEQIPSSYMVNHLKVY